MRRFACVSWLSALALVALAGCAENSFVLKGRVDKLQQQQLAMSRQNQLLQGRASDLDQDNQEIESLLAQSRQQNQVLEDRLAVIRDQLRGATSQLAQAREERESSDKRVQALTTSMRNRGSVSITPNNSLLQTLPVFDQPGVKAQRDGDVIRVTLPGSRLFSSGSAQLKPEAIALITDVAARLIASYPNQVIGVEGHTDTRQMSGDKYPSNWELSAARAAGALRTLLDLGVPDEMIGESII